MKKKSQSSMSLNSIILIEVVCGVQFSKYLILYKNALGVIIGMSTGWHDIVKVRRTHESQFCIKKLKGEFLENCYKWKRQIILGVSKNFMKQILFHFKCWKMVLRITLLFASHFFVFIIPLE